MKHLIHFDGLWRGLLLLAVSVLTIAPTPCNLRIAEIPGGSEKPGRVGTSDVFAVDHELVQPIDPLTGAASSARQHRPLTVLKVIDRASPGLHRALATGQTFREVELDFYQLEPATRVETKYYTITLKNARIVGLKTMVPTTFLPENESYGHMEEVRFAYEMIQWHWIPDAIVEQDAWRGRPGIHAAAGAPAPVARGSLGGSASSATTVPVPDTR